MLYQLSYSRAERCRGSGVASNMEGGGFEPPKAYAGRFTVCSL